MNDFYRNNLNPQSIDSRFAPSAVTFRKIVYRLADLPVSPAALMEVGLGSTKEVRIYSDFPIDIQIGDSGEPEKLRTDIFFRGNVSKLKIGVRRANAVGVVVIYVGDPYLGVDWKRESPEDKSMVTFGGAPFSIAGNDFVAGGVSTFFLFDDSSYGLEAVYIRSISFERDVGVVKRIVFTESETGLTLDLLSHRFRDPRDIDTLVFEPYLRISAKGDLGFHLSPEAVGTNLNFEVTGGFV